MVTQSKPKLKLPDTFLPGQSYYWPCQYCNHQVWSPRGLINAYLDCTCKEGKFVRDRGLADDRQKKLERTNKLRETNWMFGEPGSGKSWVALYVVQESILSPNPPNGTARGQGKGVRELQAR